MVLIELAGLGRVIGMRVIPADDVDAFFAGGFFGVADVVGGHRETVARRIVAAIDQRKKRGDFARGRASPPDERAVAGVEIAAEERAATFVRDRFRAAVFARDLLSASSH